MFTAHLLTNNYFMKNHDLKPCTSKQTNFKTLVGGE